MDCILQNDMELVVDLKQETSVHKAWVRTYVEIGEEILDVRSISVLSSADGKIYKELKTVDYPAVTSKDKMVFTNMKWTLIQ